MSEPPPRRILLLRHGQVASHRGDVPVTEDGLADAMLAGKALATAYPDPVTVLHGGTRRSRETAEALVAGTGDRGRVHGPVDAFALRNPDIYVAGVRVNMVTSAAAVAEQVPGLSEADAAAHPFFGAFVSTPDRVGWWLAHPDPHGDTANVVADRVAAFARSVDDPGPLRPPRRRRHPLAAAACRAVARHRPGSRRAPAGHRRADPCPPGRRAGRHPVRPPEGLSNTVRYRACRR